jgi:hypothetical protein
MITGDLELAQGVDERGIRIRVVSVDVNKPDE